MTVMQAEVSTLASGLAMGESARWHDGWFWCSDWVAGEILVVGPDGGMSVAARSTSFPFCFDWLADGTMLVTGSTGLDRWEPGAGDVPGVLAPYADLTDLIPGGWNEVIVDPRGNAFVNAPNFDMSGGSAGRRVGEDPSEARPGAGPEFGTSKFFEVGSTAGVIGVVTQTGEYRLVADQVAFPNGMALTPDGSTLIVGESFASRLSAWDVAPDGSLSGRRVWATLADGVDGICIDAEGAVWCATQHGVERVLDGGEVTHRVPLDLFGFSCALGGPDGRTLFIVANKWEGFENIGKGPRTGHIYTIQVDVPRPT